ncbi:MAG: DMT family transporter [Candidatus Zixiibacteriota bacterium]
MKLQRNTAEIFLITTTAIWGSTFLIIKLLVTKEDIFSPFALLFSRFALSSIIAYLVFRPKGLPNKDVLIGGFIIGIAAFGGYAFQTLGLLETTPARSGFITSLFVVFTPFLSRVLEKQEISRAIYISLIPALFGLWAISGTQFSFNDINPGDKITLLSAISYAFQVVGIQIYTKKYDWKWLTVLQFAFIALFSSFGLPFEDIKFPTNNIAYYAIIYLALFATVGALGIQMFAQRFTTSSRASLVYIAEPLFATFFAYIFIGEGLSKVEVLGGILIICSMIIGRMRLRKSNEAIGKNA